MSFFVSYEGRNDEAKEGRDYLQGVAESASISRPGEGQEDAPKSTIRSRMRSRIRSRTGIVLRVIQEAFREVF